MFYGELYVRERFYYFMERRITFPDQLLILAYRLLNILQCIVTFLAGTNLHNVFYIVYEDLPIADMTGIKNFLCSVNNTPHRNLADNDIHLYFRQEIRFHRNTTIVFGTTTLYATTKDVGYRHTGNTKIR